MADLKAAKEAFSLGGGGIVPIVAVDDVKIGDGKVGLVFKAVDALLLSDMRQTHRHRIPFEDVPSRSASVWC